MQMPRKVSRITIQDHLTALQQRHLQVEVVQDLDEGSFEPGNLESVFDSANESNRIDLCANILEQTSDERCKE